MRRLLLCALLLFGLGLAGCATPPPGPLRVTLLAINDFHGNLQPPRGGLRRPDPADPGKSVNLPAGGAAVLAGAVRELAAANPNTVFVAAGDLIGASPLVSALFKDEPTVQALSQMGLVVSAVGNHEFDHGSAELLRLQGLASFQYLAASTIVVKTGRTLLPPYWVRSFDGVPVAFIGLTLKDTPDIVVPAGVAGLRFLDEAETVNALVPQLQAQGIRAIVVLIHEGGFPAAGPGDCPGLSGAIVPIVRKLDPAVGLVISGHTHREYLCRIDGRLLTSAGAFGTLLTQIDLVLDRASGELRSADAHNVVVSPDRFKADPAIDALVQRYQTAAVPLARRVVAPLALALPRDEAANGESPVGRLVADAQLAGTRDAGAQIALMNPGGLRAALAPGPDGMLHYEDLFTVQPFYNNLVTMTLTGAQLRQLLEQQWQDQPKPRVLQVSAGFSYTWDASRPPGRRVLADSLRLDGAPVTADQRLRVTVNSFLASGGDSFGVLKQGADRRTGMMDIDALEAYLRAGGQAAAGERIRRLN
jgi:5'-nucleotidase